MVRLVALAFGAVERGRISIPGVFPETVQPTRRIVVALLWLFALIVSYRYLPGSDSDAFKGVSVFVGYGLAGLVRHHEPNHERPDHHLLPCAAIG